MCVSLPSRCRSRPVSDGDNTDPVQQSQPLCESCDPELNLDNVQAEMDEYADCFINPEKLPEDEIRSALAVVTGSLGLSFPRTADAMRRAVKIAKSAGTTVRGLASPAPSTYAVGS